MPHHVSNAICSYLFLCFQHKLLLRLKHITAGTGRATGWPIWIIFHGIFPAIETSGSSFKFTVIWAKWSWDFVNGQFLVGRGKRLPHSELSIVIPRPRHLSIFLGLAESFGSVTVLVVCGCVSPTLAVPSTQSHHPCVTPGSISRLPLCWFQIRHWLAGISQAWGLYSLSFCLVLSFPLSFCRARPSVNSEAASFLVVTSSDYCLHGLICPFWCTTRMPPCILKSNSCL